MPDETHQHRTDPSRPTVTASEAVSSNLTAQHDGKAPRASGQAARAERTAQGPGGNPPPAPPISTHGETKSQRGTETNLRQGVA